MPTLEQLMPKVYGSTIFIFFSKLYAKQGNWNVNHDAASLLYDNLLHILWEV